jgi:hypothetical protein
MELVDPYFLCENAEVIVESMLGNLTKEFRIEQDKEGTIIFSIAVHFGVKLPGWFIKNWMPMALNNLSFSNMSNDFKIEQL